MKKIKLIPYLLIALLAVGIVFADNLNTDYGNQTISHTWVVADTVATAARFDTSYSPVIELGKEARVLFFSVSASWNRPMTGDSLSLILQHSCDKINWVNYPTQIGSNGTPALPLKSADGDTVFQSALRLRLDSLLTAPIFIQNYTRVMGIYHDSTEADAPDSLGTVFKVDYDVYLRVIK